MQDSKNIKLENLRFFDDWTWLHKLLLYSDRLMGMEYLSLPVRPRKMLSRLSLSVLGKAIGLNDPPMQSSLTIHAHRFRMYYLL